PALLLLASGAAAVCGFACLMGLGAILYLAEHGPDRAAPVIGVGALAGAAAASALAGGVWWAAGHDLALMREGRKDPGGHGPTAWARRLALATLALPPAALALGALLANWP